MTEKLSKLHHDGHITNEEYDRLKKALNSLRVVQEIRQEIADFPIASIDRNVIYLPDVLEIIDKYIKEYTE